MHAFGRQKDGRTDRILIARPRMHAMQRVKTGLQFATVSLCNSEIVQIRSYTSTEREGRLLEW